MTRLLFTADGQLREQARGGKSRVLARVAEDRDGARFRLLAGNEEHEIVPFAQTGWGFELRDGEGARSGGFQPFRLRRGGRLRVREVRVSLHGRPWAHEGWALSLPDGRRVEANVTALGDEWGRAEQASHERVRGGEGAAGSAARDGAFAVQLEAVGSLELLALTEVLALGSWLIARWHVTPAADHVLASAAGGPGLGRASVKSASAGIRA
ncbi:MAG: hypothetical protein ACHQHO_04600 [Solirubrobacterales bacterium]